MNDVVDTGKCIVCAAVSLVLVLGASVAVLALVLNTIKAALF